MTECQLVEKTSEESVKMVSADLASAKNKRESRIGLVNANHEVSTEPKEAREPLQPATAGQRTDLRRRDAGPERVPHAGQPIDDDRLPHEQTDCGLMGDADCWPSDQSM